MKSDDLLATFDSLRPVRALVVGDLILDRYTWGDAERVSQEAPVILLRADRREDRLGGAANVCQLLRGLDAEVACAGVLGADTAGEKMLRMLARAGIDDAGVLADRGRPTTCKERFIGRAANRHGHQILRVDTEVRDPLAAGVESDLAALVERWLSETSEELRFHVVLISDYDKGVCTPALLARVIPAARAAQIPVVVDPLRGADYSRYRGATTMTPNRLEAGLATGMKIGSPQDAFTAGGKLCEELDLDFAVITLDRDGMALIKRQVPTDARHFPTRPRDVYDITGAGDMVLATIGVCLAAGLDPTDAVRLGNITGGLEVEKEGVVVLTREEIRRDILREVAAQSPPSSPHMKQRPEEKLLPLDDLLAAVARHRAGGRSIVLTNGCFDLLHVGHLRTLEEAAGQGDVLIVAVNSDKSVRRLKGPSRPIIGQDDRLRMLAALSMVDYVIPFDAATPLALVNELRPDVLVKGRTYKLDEVVGREEIAAYGGRVHLVPPLEGVSTTSIVGQLTDHPVLAGPHRRPSIRVPIPPLKPVSEDPSAPLDV